MQSVAPLHINKSLPRTFFTYNHLSLTSRRRYFVLSHSISRDDIHKIFLRAKLKIKVVLFWSSIIKDLRMYGTGSSLFDGSMNYKECLPQAMEKKVVSKVEKEQNKIEVSKKCIILPSFLTYKSWNFILSFGLVYTCIVMPWVLAFEEVRPVNIWYVFELIIDCIYFIDIIITLNLAYKDSSKKLVFNRSEIFKNYIKGLFVFDILAILPFKFILVNSPNFNSYIKIVRIGRLSRVFKILKVDKFILSICGGRESTYVAMNRLITGLALIMLLVHFVACIWNYLPKADYYSPASWIIRRGDIDKSPGSLYLTGFYYAVTTILTVGLGDYSAYNKSEMVLCIILELAGICFYSFILGVMTSLLTSIDHKEVFVNGKVQMVNLFATDIKLSKNIQNKMENEIRIFYELNQLDDTRRQGILLRIPKKIKYSCCLSMYKGNIFKLFFLQKQEKIFCSSYVPRLNYLKMRDREMVFFQGDYPDNCYFLLSGRVSFVFSDRNIVFKTMIAGSFFGEIGLMQRQYRDFGAMTCGDCELLVMSAELVREMAQQFPVVYNQIKKVAELRKISNKRDREDIVNLLDIYEVRKSHTFEQLAGIRVNPEESSEEKELEYPSDWFDYENNLELQNLVYTHELQVTFTQIIKKRLEFMESKILRLCKIIN